MASSPPGITAERQQRRASTKVRRALLREAVRVEKELDEHTAREERERDRLLLDAWEAGALYSEIAAATKHPVSWVIRHLGQAREARDT